MSKADRLASLANELRNTSIRMMRQAAIMADGSNHFEGKAARGEFAAALLEARHTIAQIRAQFGEELKP